MKIVTITDLQPALKNGWSRREKWLFRIIFSYCCLQALPLDWKYYRNLANIDWTGFSYRELFYISRYTAQFVSGAADRLNWGLNSLADWALIACLAIIAGGIWGYYDRRRKSYNDLYYAMRVLLRGRLAIALMAYGFIKLFPMEQPYPSIGLLNTSYGAFSDWKIASLSYGVAPSLERFLGAVEIFAALLLLNRKSASVGAAIVIGFTGNVLLTNLGYGGGETVYCLYLLSFASILLYYDLPRWVRLISFERPTWPQSYRPQGALLLRNIRRAVKMGFVLLIFLYAGLALHMYQDNPYQYPGTPGLPGASGLYTVNEFILNNQSRPYSLTDTLRWQNVAFEKWNTVSIRSLQPVEPDRTNTEEIYASDKNRNYESSGSNERRFYSYQTDSLRHILHLINKNENYKADSFDLQYQRITPERLILSGKNSLGDSVYAVLDRLKKIYLLNESYAIPGKRSVFQ